jgi:hypothetical protein
MLDLIALLAVTQELLALFWSSRHEKKTSAHNFSISTSKIHLAEAPSDKIELSLYPESGLVKPPRRNTRALSPAGMFEGNVPLCRRADRTRHQRLCAVRLLTCLF